MVKVTVKCSECGREYIIKIPFRLRKRVDNIEMNCGCGKTIEVIYINKIDKKEDSSKI